MSSTDIWDQYNQAMGQFLRGWDDGISYSQSLERWDPESKYSKAGDQS